MLRCMRVAVGLVLIVATMGRAVDAQGRRPDSEWWGWDPRAPQSFGSEFFAMGAGIYDLELANANAIDAETTFRWNDYVARITQQSDRLTPRGRTPTSPRTGRSMMCVRNNSGTIQLDATSRPAMPSTWRSPI
jgi:hypothetical protein